MDWTTFLFRVLLVLGLIALKRVSWPTWNYYLHMFAFSFMVLLGLFLPYFFFPFRPFDYRNANLSAVVGKYMGAALGVRYKVSGLEKLQKNGGIVLINHQSFLDLVVLAHIWRHMGPTAVIMKKELIYVPIIGFSLWSYGSIFIDRSNKNAAKRSIEIASKAIDSENKKLIIFPEGTRSVSDTLLPFRNGGFITAFEKQCDVYPIVVSKFSSLDHKKKIYKAGTGTISVLDPISAKDFKDMAALRDHCQEVMQREFDRVNALKKVEEKVVS